MPKFARVTFGEGDPVRIDESIANLNQTVIPRARELPGFQGGYWLADRATGKFPCRGSVRQRGAHSPDR